MKRSIMFGLVLGAWAASPAAWAQLLDTYSPAWLRSPSSAQIAAVHPRDAAGDLLTGRAILECEVAAKGLLTKCLVVHESPKTQAIGEAALKLTPHFQLPMTGKDAAAEGQTRRILFGFHRPFDTGPSWLKKPTPESMMTVWPKDAAKTGKAGSATVLCFIGLQGLLYDCIVRDERPAGAGFGAAALAMTPQFLMKPAMQNGQPVVSQVNIPLKFAWPGGASPNPGPPETIRVFEAARDWIEAPTVADVAAAYPAKARADRIAGYANLDCIFGKEGRLHGCRTLTEEPKRQGFAAAAKVLSKQFRANPALPTGDSLARAHVQLPVAFTTEMLDAGLPKLGKPQWGALPSLEQVKELYPAAAIKAGIKTGRAVLSCVVQPQGKLDCKIRSEDPANYGFGQAALSIAPYFTLSTWTMEGLPTIGATIGLPIRFVSELDQPPAGAAAKP